MNNLNLRSSDLPGNHLSAEEMYDYIENKLPAPARFEVEAHLLECDLCNEALDGIALAPKDQTFPNLLELNKRVKTRTTRRQKNNTLSHIKNWGLTAGIIFLVVFATIMVWIEARRATAPAPKATKNAAVTADKKAEPVNGYPELEKYISQFKPTLPEKISTENIQVIFTVNPDSTLSNFNFIPQLTPEAAIQIITFIKNGPAWKPAQKASQNISQEVKLKIPNNR